MRKYGALCVAVALLFGLFVGCASSQGPSARGDPALQRMPGIKKLPVAVKTAIESWFEEEWVGLIMTDEELKTLSELQAVYDLETFKILFWQKRSFKNGFRTIFQEEYLERVRVAKELYGTPADLRAKAFVMLGPPSGMRRINVRRSFDIESSTCSDLSPIEIFFYKRIETKLFRGEAVFIFYCEFGNCQNGGSQWKLWKPFDGWKFSQKILCVAILNQVLKRYINPARRSREHLRMRCESQRIPRMFTVRRSLSRSLKWILSGRIGFLKCGR